MKNTFLALLLAAFLSANPLSALAALNLSKNPAHYLQEMEFFYQKPRMEMLPDMLQSFARAGLLANARKRLFVAAFLSSLAPQHLNLSSLLKPSLPLDSLHTIAIAMQLTDPSVPLKSLADLFPANDQAIPASIKQIPAPLNRWQPNWEPAALDMNWAAFMATGSYFWLDRIISCATGYAHNLPGSAPCAATLYDYTPRHKAISDRITQLLPSFRESEQQVLKTILQQ